MNTPLSVTEESGVFRSYCCLGSAGEKTEGFAVCGESFFSALRCLSADASGLFGLSAFFTEITLFELLIHQGSMLPVDQIMHKACKEIDEYDCEKGYHR